LGVEAIRMMRMNAPPHLKNFMDLRGEFFQRMARAGALAPSGDNMQPWLFSVDGETLLISHDPRRDVSLFNVRSLASFIALGAVLENIIIAAASEGFYAQIEHQTNAQDQDSIVRIRFETGADKDPLVDFLEKRCTNRKPYAPRPIDPEIVKRLTATLDPFSTSKLVWVQEKSRLKQLGQIIARADRLVFENLLIHNHLFSTIRWTQDEVKKTRDGLPVKSLELGHTGSFAFRCLKHWPVVNFLNRFGFSKAAASHSVALMRHCSAAGLLTAPDTSPQTFVQVGRAFQRIWLQATDQCLALQPMTAIIFLQLRFRLDEYQGLTERQFQTVGALSRELANFFSLSSDRVPAMLFRLGFGSPPSARTIRRIPHIANGKERGDLNLSQFP
jgi:hypothetical protein